MSPITIGLERRICFINETYRLPSNELNQSEEENKFGLSSKTEHPPYGTLNMVSGNHLYMTLPARNLFKDISK